jgi:hypothetical protein
MVTSRLSENQAESVSASPRARYLEIGTNTSYPLSCAEAPALKKHNNAAMSVPIIYLFICKTLRLTVQRYYKIDALQVFR